MRALAWWALVALSAWAPPAVRAQDDGDDATAPDDVVQQDSEPQPAPAPAVRGLRLRISAGAGAGTISLERPTAAGSQLVSDVAFAASEVALQAHAWPDEAFSLAVLLSYQTSIGLELRLAPAFAVPEDVAMRLHRAELSVAPVLALADDHSVALAFPLGAELRSLVPHVYQYDLPDYDLGSALLRAELWLELASILRVHLGPELQWLALIDSTLRDEGACCHGVAFGGQAMVELEAGPTWRIALTYRESHAFLPAGDWLFSDTQRFVTARVTGEL